MDDPKNMTALDRREKPIGHEERIWIRWIELMPKGISDRKKSGSECFEAFHVVE